LITLPSRSSSFSVATARPVRAVACAVPAPAYAVATCARRRMMGGLAVIVSTTSVARLSPG